MKKSILNIISLMCCLTIMLTATSCGNNAKKEEIVVDGIIPLISESELILRSDLIIEGTVSEIMDSKWSNPNNEKGENFRNILQTDIVVNIDNYLFGERDDNQAIVRIDKGEDENTIVSSDGYPDFEVNEKVLLFLSRDDSDIATDEDYYVLTGMRQGKYDLSESENSRSSNTINTYISSMEVDNERDTEVIDELKDKIDSEATFLDLYNAIMDSVGYTKDQMCSFFICDDDWSKNTEITLVEMDTSSEVDNYIMEDTRLEELLEDEHQKLLFVFDYMTERAFFMELREIIPGKDLDKAVCSKSIGEAPVQIMSFDEMDAKTGNTEIGEDFYGDSEYDIDELDKEGFDGLGDGPMDNPYDDERF